MQKSKQQKRAKIGKKKIIEHQMRELMEIEYLKQKHNDSVESEEQYATKLIVSKDRYDYYKALSKDGQLLGLNIEIGELENNQIGLE